MIKNVNYLKNFKLFVFFNVETATNSFLEC